MANCGITSDNGSLSLASDPALRRKNRPGFLYSSSSAVRARKTQFDIGDDDVSNMAWKHFSSKVSPVLFFLVKLGGISSRIAPSMFSWDTPKIGF